MAAVGLAFPRVQMETPAPPVFGKETLAEFVPSRWFFPFTCGIRSEESLVASRLSFGVAWQ